MNKGFTQYIIKGIVFLVLVYVILLAMYQQDLAHASFFALVNTIQLAVIGIIFTALSFKKLVNIKVFKHGVKSSIISAVVAAGLLGARYMYYTMPYRFVASAIGFLALFGLVFSYWNSRVLIREYKKEIIITAVIAIAIQVVMYLLEIPKMYAVFY